MRKISRFICNSFFHFLLNRIDTKMRGIIDVFRDSLILKKEISRTFIELKRQPLHILRSSWEICVAKAKAMIVSPSNIYISRCVCRHTIRGFTGATTYRLRFCNSISPMANLSNRNAVALPLDKQQFLK